MMNDEHIWSYQGLFYIPTIISIYVVYFHFI